MNLAEILATVVNQNTLGGLIIVTFFTLLGVLIKGMLSNHGTIAVAKINSETTLGTKAIETLTTALEVLQEENRSLKANIKMLESHIESLIEYILHIVKAKHQDEVDKAVQDLEQFLRAIGRWPH